MTYQPIPQDLARSDDIAPVAREDGGNLELIAQLLQILAAIDGGAGASSSHTVRTVTASDDPTTQQLAGANLTLASILAALALVRAAIVTPEPTDVDGLAVESGGNLDQIAAALNILREIDGGAGSSTNKTQRMILAADDPAVAALLALLAKPSPDLSPVIEVAPAERMLSRETDSVEVGGMVEIDGKVETVSPPVCGMSRRALIVSTTAVRLFSTNIGAQARVLTNNSTGSLTMSPTSDLAASGGAIGLIVPASGSFSDSGPGMWRGEWWGLYSASASAENIVAVETY